MRYVLMVVEIDSGAQRRIGMTDRAPRAAYDEDVTDAAASVRAARRAAVAGGSGGSL